MPIPVMCPECGAKMILSESALGQRKKCPECGDPFTVRSVNDTECDDPADTSPLHPGWRRVARGYHMLGFAFLFLLLGVFATAGAVFATGELYRQQVIQDSFAILMAGWTTGLTCGLVVMVFAFLGHLYFLAVPSDDDGGKGKDLAVTMLMLLFIPGLNGLILLLLPVFSAGVGTALNNWRLSHSGWNLYTWYAAGALAVPMLAYGCIFGGISLDIPVPGFIAAGLILVVGWSLTCYAIWGVFTGLRRGIEETIREGGLRG